MQLALYCLQLVCGVIVFGYVANVDDENDGKVANWDCDDECAFLIAGGVLIAIYAIVMIICYLISALEIIAAKTEHFIAIFMLLWCAAVLGAGS